MIPYPICIRIKETGLFCSPNFFLFAWLCICWFFLHPYTSWFAFAISEQIRVVRLIQKYISITSIFILLHIIKYISKYFSKFCGKLRLSYLNWDFDSKSWIVDFFVLFTYLMKDCCILENNYVIVLLHLCSN